jgi:FAD/FMN-containing dehydrogenase
LSTNKLNKIIEHVPADLIASAEAGVTLDDFNSDLNKNGQWLPLDPPDRGTSTLGGIIATGLAGPQLLGYGPPRRFVIGMRVVLADGRVIKVGGKVVKNVAGYDLSKLFTGSYGTLGVITELTFKLRPLPALNATAVLQGPLDALFSVASAINSALLAPVAMEVVSNEFPDQANPTQEPRLFVRFAGSEKAVTHQLELTRKFAAQQDAVQTTSTDSEVVWRTIANTACDASRVVSRVTVTSSKVLDLVKLLEADESWQASPGTGVIRIFKNPEDDLVALAQRLNTLRAHAGRLGGSLVIENAPPALKMRVDCWGGYNSATSLMARIKQQLDPANILSPGRF